MIFFSNPSYDDYDDADHNNNNDDDDNDNCIHMPNLVIGYGPYGKWSNVWVPLCIYFIYR